MTMFIPTFSARPVSFGAVSNPEQTKIIADSIASDPYYFQKLAVVRGGHGWLGPTSTRESTYDTRRSDPTIYPGSDNPDWKYLKGSQYVFVFKDDSMESGFWYNRDFFDDVMKEGWLKSKNWKFIVNRANMRQVEIPDAPWQVKAWDALKTVNPILELVEDYGQSDFAQGVADAPGWVWDQAGNFGENINWITKNLKYILGGAVLLFIYTKYSKRK